MAGAIGRAFLHQDTFVSRVGASRVGFGLCDMPVGATSGRWQTLGPKNLAISGDEGRVFAYYALFLVQLDLTLKL